MFELAKNGSITRGTRNLFWERKKNKDNSVTTGLIRFSYITEPVSE